MIAGLSLTGACQRSSAILGRSTPRTSRTAPMAHAPNAEAPKPTVECIAIVAPRFSGFAAIVMSAVNAPESAGTVPA